jgi:release factor glutamine methyltransferase
MTLPVQYLTNKAYFMDFEFMVDGDTFIPRPETELLVEKALEKIKEIESSKPRMGSRLINILDIGVGSGNISISLTKYAEQSKILALDISHRTLVKARLNARTIGCDGRISFIRSDLFSGLAVNPYFDIIISNPPYISSKDMDALDDEVKCEPFRALYGGKDGLYYQRRILDEGRSYLRKGGYCLLEIGYDQGIAVRKLMEQNDFKDIEISKDYAGIDRIACARYF